LTSIERLHVAGYSQHWFCTYTLCIVATLMKDSATYIHKLT